MLRQLILVFATTLASHGLALESERINYNKELSFVLPKGYQSLDTMGLKSLAAKVGSTHFIFHCLPRSLSSGTHTVEDLDRAYGELLLGMADRIEGVIRDQHPVSVNSARAMRASIHYSGFLVVKQMDVLVIFTRKGTYTFIVDHLTAEDTDPEVLFSSVRVSDAVTLDEQLGLDPYDLGRLAARITLILIVLVGFIFIIRLNR